MKNQVHLIEQNSDQNEIILNSFELNPEISRLTQRFNDNRMIREIREIRVRRHWIVESQEDSDAV